MRIFRIPFSWDRLQPTLNGRLNPAEVARLDHVISDANKIGVQVILDVHGYDRWQGVVIGSDSALESAFSYFWILLADHYRSQLAVYAYGLMNEPHDTNGTWPHTAQAAINAIRTVDSRHFILLAGDHWSNANSWQEANPYLLEVRDPDDRIVYEAHIYFDHDGSGVYKHSYDEEGAYPSIGADRLLSFIAWLRANKKQGLLGEFGVPNNDPRWNVVLEQVLEVLRHNHLSGTYWAGGPIWHNYGLSCEPMNGHDAPQMAILSKYAEKDRRHWYQVWRFAAR
jgi:endoglucanase